MQKHKPRAVICVDDPWNYIPGLDDYSLMIINPASSPARLNYLLEKSDWSLLITSAGKQHRSGGLYNEKLFWYTSGTTGDSKFCSFTQEQLDNTIKTICRSYNITALDRYVSIMPLWHAHGQGFYWATKHAGCEQNFLSVRDLKSLPTYRPTFVTAIPDILNVISNFNLPDLRFIRSASSPLPDDLYKKLSANFNVPIIEAFGMTEALSHCFTNPLDGKQKIGTVGLPDGIEAKIVNKKLYIRGPSVFINDWYDTGDLAEQDADGYYTILGRDVDQINIRGMKFNPVSLENQLKNKILNLGDCVIYGSNDVKCLYTGSCDSDDIKKFLSDLHTYCAPSTIKKVDAIPLSPSGKLSRSWLNTL